MTAGRRNAFTLVELSLVLLVLSVLSAAALRYSTARTDSTNTATLNATLDVVDTALLNYRLAYGRLPCPADITLAENNNKTANSVVYYFGQEMDTSGIGSGSCGGANMTSTNFAVGGIPTRTLRLPDKYAYDAWGRKIEYGVDIRMTTTNAFTLYPIFYLPTSGTKAFNVYNSYNVNMTGSTVYPVYLLVSMGKNGHGGFVRNIKTVCTLGTCPIFNYGSTNTDEQKNCNCNGTAAVNATYPTSPAVFVQDNPNVINGGAVSTTFDDTVRYKTRAQMASTSELK
jgi:prepilin-type N-terminal cleavage/methylation domain-containing protein